MEQHPELHLPQRIVSGGQTGVDRSALDVAIALAIEHGGWCPRGRLAEDGPIAKRYRLQETESADYPVRTERNVIDSTGTLILYRQRIFGGTQLTHRLARQHQRPCLLVDLDHDPDAELVRRWIRDRDIDVLNVAGPRESSSPGIGRKSHSFLEQVLRDPAGG